MPTFRIEMECSGLFAEVRLNDVPVFRDRTASPRMQESAVNHWLVDGENVLEAELVAPPDETRRAFEVDLFRDRERILEWRWSESAPLAWSARFQLDPGFGRWAWQDAGAAPITTADRAAVAALQVEIRDALSRGDVDFVMQRLELQQTEMARAHELPVEASRDRQRRYLEACVGAERFRLEPLDSGSLLLEPRAGGRLVFATDAHGRSPVRGVAGAAVFLIPSVASKIDGAWRIVR